MNNELLKKLKESGFPIKEYKYTRLTEDNITEHDRVFTPTLEELIEACGENFEVLIKTDADLIWMAHTDRQCAESYPCGEGSTPSEAVANLWININNKE